MQMVFIGPPGAGKGTQCQRLAKLLQADHVSTGQLLRDEITAGSEAGQQAQALLADGQLAPDGMVLGMLRQKLRTTAPERGLLLDGFPRTLAQAEELEQLLQEFSRPLSMALELAAPEEEIVRRLSLRGREDDAADTVRTRLRVFADQTAPVVQFYRDRQILHAVDGTGSENEVFARIRACVDACQKKAG